jgi:hypothetical protein
VVEVPGGEILKILRTEAGCSAIEGQEKKINIVIVEIQTPDSPATIY